MKVKHLLFTLIIGFGYFTSSVAQDFHYTMWDMTPVSLNPALSGSFLGTARVSGIYRGQWATAANKSYQTPSLNIDAPVIQGFRKQDWLGVGVSVLMDQAGDLALRQTEFTYSAAYHLGLNKKGTSVITLGGHGGSVSKRIEYNKAIFGTDDATEINLLQEVDQDLAKAGYTDYGGGIAFKAKLNKTMDMNIGFAMGHLNQAQDALLSNGATKDREKNILSTAHGQFNANLSEKWKFSPSFIYQTTTKASEVLLSIWNGYQWNEDYNFRGGLGYRLGDAASILLGVDYKALRIAAAYDVNLSELNNVSKYRGGFELAASYIIKIYKKPEVKPAILCPEL